MIIGFLSMTKELRINYEEFSSKEGMNASDRALVDAAVSAVSRSYSPYSHFQVGAAVLLEDGTVVLGTNQENAAFPSSLCAERTALFSAGVGYPDKAVVAIAIAGGPEGVLTDEPVTPCGSCRQVMSQFQKKSGRPMAIILVGGKRIWKFDCVESLLPFVFDSI